MPHGFHFPVMPRIFMARAARVALPDLEILAQHPGDPVDGAQWGIFLRNHDELTLEMVTDEERDYMYGWYAPDPRMKANIGIRRRLAPLLDNDRNEIELFTALLLSLPGSPVLYYGDEIGMGDNIWLGDRDGVRTPMQWTPDRNAGFSTADPGRLTCRWSWTRLRLPGDQRRGAEPHDILPAALDAQDAAPAPGATRPSVSASSSTSAGPTRRCCRSCASSATTSCCASTTSPGSRSRSSSTCVGGRAGSRSS